MGHSLIILYLVSVFQLHNLDTLLAQCLDLTALRRNVPISGSSLVWWFEASVSCSWTDVTPGGVFCWFWFKIQRRSSTSIGSNLGLFQFLLLLSLDILLFQTIFCEPRDVCVGKSQHISSFWNTPTVCLAPKTLHVYSHSSAILKLRLNSSRPSWACLCVNQHTCCFSCFFLLWQTSKATN